MPASLPIRVADLSPGHPTDFALRPDSADLQKLAAELGLSGLRKLAFSGRVEASGSRDWMLTATLGATVTQPCIVTLEPVVTRIDTHVTRRFLADMPTPDAAEIEMPEDVSTDPLGDTIDPARIMVEELSLALPLYPRKDAAEPTDQIFAPPGVEPIRDSDVKPFAALRTLRDKMEPKP